MNPNPNQQPKSGESLITKVLFRKIFKIIKSGNGTYGYYEYDERMYNNVSDGEYIILVFEKYNDTDSYFVTFYYVRKENWKEHWKEINSFYVPSLETLVFTDWRSIVLNEINRVKTYGPVSVMDFLDQMLRCVEKKDTVDTPVVGGGYERANPHYT